MSYTKKINATVHGDHALNGYKALMTVEEFEHTVSIWEKEAPELAAHIRRLQKSDEVAWGVIANASDWDSKARRVEWQEAAKLWRDTYYRPSADQSCAGVELQEGMTPAEAVYLALAWLTTQPEPVTFSRGHNAALAAELAVKFCKLHELGKPRSDWGRVKP